MMIALTETHLTKDVSDSETKLENYIPNRADQSGRSHGGTILYRREDIAVNINSSRSTQTVK